MQPSPYNSQKQHECIEHLRWQLALDIRYSDRSLKYRAENEMGQGAYETIDLYQYRIDTIQASL